MQGRWLLADLATGDRHVQTHDPIPLAEESCLVAGWAHLVVFERTIRFRGLVDPEAMIVCIDWFEMEIGMGAAYNQGKPGSEGKAEREGGYHD
jgi:hypothetical protein